MIGAFVAIGIVLIVIAGATVVVVSYHRLLTHRSDAAAMAAYRPLAEQSADGQEQLHQRLHAIDARIAAMESLLREVG